MFESTELTPRQRLLAVFDKPAEFTHDGMPLHSFVAAAVQIADPEHPARVRAREYKESVTARMTETAREAGAADPEPLGEQLALLLDGASARPGPSALTPSQPTTQRPFAFTPSSCFYSRAVAFD
ncbi:hypothetical protein [Mycolicibacterium sp. 624]|uniref:hypothetical protein n=1 Tax=Mycolicibacterium sp. 624 TaxID=3156314 RepID=UPI0033987814